MRAVHNTRDLEVIGLLMTLIERIEKDAKRGLATDAEPVIRYAHSYLNDARAELDGVVKCDAVSDLGFLRVRPEVIREESTTRLRIYQGNEELNYCSLWCFFAQFMRKEGVNFLPAETLVDRRQ